MGGASTLHCKAKAGLSGAAHMAICEIHCHFCVRGPGSLPLSSEAETDLLEAWLGRNSPRI